MTRPASSPISFRLPFLLALLVGTACDTKGGAVIDADRDGFSRDEDCDDENASIHPEASEICDGIDNDCDDLIDDRDDSLDGPAWSRDADGDGYGDPATTKISCEQPLGTVSDDGDCDDANPNIHPGAKESWYDGVDQNCDELSDFDQDADGFDAAAFEGTDCDDLDPTVNPDAEEIWYDGRDQNCDELSDYDQDGDGHDSSDWDGDDCIDTDPSAHPGAKEIWYDGVDQNCDGLSDYDQDADGYDTSAHGGEDCDDLDATVSPLGEETWYDGVDQNCDGLSDYDQDLDGYDASAHSGDDCDDTRGDVHPGAVETWYDGVDGDCDGESDYDQDGDGYDSSAYRGTDCDDTAVEVHPGGAETWYDGVDGDCDGRSDYDADGDGYDSSAFGGTDCNDASALVSPAATQIYYDGIDQNCDGRSDYDADGDGYDSSAHGGTDCDDTRATAYPGATEVWYDGIDQNCDGRSDYDQDYDGYLALAYGGTDCDDTRATAYPGGAEVWYDGIDGDCDGRSDYDQDGDGEDASSHGGTDCDDRDPSMNSRDADGDGFTTCEEDCDDANPAISPGEYDVPDGIDNDCDGTVDNPSSSTTLSTYADFLPGLPDGHGRLTTTGGGEIRLALRPSGFSTGAAQASLPTAVSNPQVVTTGGYVYVMGGATGSYTSGTSSSGVYAGALSSAGAIASWTTLTSLPVALSSAGAATDGRCIVLAGGYTSSSSSPTSAVYTARVNGDGTLGTWTARSSLPSGRAYPGAVIVNGFVYVIGGSSSTATLDDVYVGRLDPDCSIDAWTATTDIPSARYYHAVASGAGQLYVVGGRNSTSVFSTVYRAVPSDDGTISSWSTETSLPASTYGLAAAVANGYLYASGGNNGSETLDDIWYASVNASGALSSWGTASTSLSGPRVFHRLVAWDGALYQVGGREDDLEYYATRSAVVYRLPLRTSTSSTYAYDSAYTCLVDLGADVEVVAIEWTDTAVSDGLVGLSYRLASSATANAGSWSDLGTGGAGYVFETGRYVQIRAMLSSNAATATSLDDITVLWRR